MEDNEIEIYYTFWIKKCCKSHLRHLMRCSSSILKYKSNYLRLELWLNGELILNLHFTPAVYVHVVISYDAMHLFEDIYCGGAVVETLALTVYNT